MLNKTEKIIITGESLIDGVPAEGFQAQIDSSRPQEMTMTSWQINKELYKANRSVCRADEAEFEDYAYAKQDEMIAALAGNEEPEEVVEA